MEAIISNGTSDIQVLAEKAAEIGDLDTLNNLVLKGYDVDYDYIMSYAAYRGYRSIVERMLELGATNYDIAVKNATKRILEQINKMIELGFL